MTNINLSEQLKAEAIERGLCEKWQREWGENPSPKELIEKYKKGIDFCIAHDWPSPDFAKRHFGGIMHDYGIYVNENVEIEDANGVYVLLGKCTGVIKSVWFSLADIYILHDSDVKIVASDGAKMYVNKSTSAKVNCVKHDNAEIKEYIIKTGENKDGRN